MNTNIFIFALLSVLLSGCVIMRRSDYKLQLEAREDIGIVKGINKAIDIYSSEIKTYKTCEELRKKRMGQQND